MKRSLWKCLLLSALTAISLNVYADWECYVADSGGHVWTSVGSTQEHANKVALSFCSAYSPDGDSCHMSRCLTK